MVNRDRSARWRAGAALCAALLCAAAASLAQSSQRPLTIRTGHAEVITLAGTAGVALIADPAIADIVSERNNLMFVLGKKPGTTNLLVYDRAGQRLLERDIQVLPDDSATVTITRETDVKDYYCQPRCIFYDHEAGGSTGAGAGSMPAPVPTAGAAGNAAPALPSPMPGLPAPQPAG